MQLGEYASCINYREVRVHDPTLNSIPESLVRLKIGRTTLYDLIARGELETVKIGRRRLIPEASICAYIERLRSQGAA